MECTQYILATNRFTLQNSGTLSMTNILGTQFLENTVLSTCFIVVNFLSNALINFGHPEDEPTDIKNKPLSLTCA